MNRFQEIRDDHEFPEQHDLLIQFLDHVGTAMYRRGASIPQVAKRAGIPPMMMVRILDAEIDLDLRQMADIGWALGIRWDIKFVSRKVDRKELRKEYIGVLSKALNDVEGSEALFSANPTSEAAQDLAFHRGKSCGMAKAIDILDNFDAPGIEV